ncbi:hypothetical protein FACS189454_08200 [Planctomycetales bacterium]|nr:hypothetical protein FACS189454_08200 [Planctomycetales bacterium]
MSGVVNAHAHLELSSLSKPLDVPSRKMSDWVGALLKFRHSDSYQPEAAIRAALQSLRGTIAVADIVPPRLHDISFSTADCFHFSFIELIAWREDQINQLQPAIRDARFLSPHAPQTVCPALLEQVVQAGVPVAMHLAETKDELALLRHHRGGLLEMMRRADSDYSPKKVLLGKRPLDYLQLLSQAPKALVIHGNYLDDEELRFLAAHRETMAVVYCPRSHAYFRHKPYPLQKMLDLGVRVLLGTDSLASSPDLNVVNEMRFAQQQHPNVPLETIIRLGTSESIEFFGPSDCKFEVGVLR